MAGMVVTTTETKIVGWAMLRHDPYYRVTVHLVLGQSVLRTTIADMATPVPAPTVTTPGNALCWFEFDLVDSGIEVAATSVCIGETREVLARALGAPTPLSGASSPDEEFHTYRDALSRGLEPIDIIHGLYLDILRRSADEDGLAHFQALIAGDPSGYDRARCILLSSEEYHRHPRRLIDAAGNIFNRSII